MFDVLVDGFISVGARTSCKTISQFYAVNVETLYASCTSENCIITYCISNKGLRTSGRIIIAVVKANKSLDIPMYKVGNSGDTEI